MDTQPLKVMQTEGGSFGRWLGHESGPLRIDYKRDPRATTFLQLWMDMATTALTLTFDASGTTRTNFYCL